MAHLTSVPQPLPIRIKKGLRLTWREPGVLQIGLVPGRAVTLTGLTLAEEELIAMLDDGVDSAEFRRRAKKMTEPDRLEGILETLRSSEVLDETATDRWLVERQLDRWAPESTLWDALGKDGDGVAVVKRRHDACVQVIGLGRTGMQIATGLVTSGIGSLVASDPNPVRVVDLGFGFGRGDLGAPREIAAAKVMNSIHPQLGYRTSVPAKVDLAVVVEQGVADPARSIELMRAEIPFLSVVLREEDALVGPLVIPGVTGCLRCLDLYRTDHDPMWPRIATQVAGSSWAHGRAEAAGLAALAGAFALNQALALIDGRRIALCGAQSFVSAVGVISAPRDCPPHGTCGCRWPPDDMEV